MSGVRTALQDDLPGVSLQSPPSSSWASLAAIAYLLGMVPN
jgi:hypothetical protein